MPLSFTKHAHDRLLERFGIRLSNQEVASVSEALAEKVGGRKSGVMECYTTVRRGLIRFKAVIDCRKMKVLTVLPQCGAYLPITRRRARKDRRFNQWRPEDWIE